MKAQKQTKLGELVASHNDTLNGEPITESSIPFGILVGTIELTKDGEKKKMQVTNTGMSVAIDHKGRTFYFDIKKLAEHAIENGLLEDTIDFKSED